MPWDRLTPGTEVIVLLDKIAYTAFVHAAEDPHAPTVVEVRQRCCDGHNRNCEPTELCCARCREAAHPDHRDGSLCDAPNLWRTGGATRPRARRARP